MKRPSPAAAVVAALSIAATNGCGRKPPPAPSPASTTGISAPSRPPDHALPDEIAEGTEKAFGLAVPRRMRIVARFDDVVFASGDLPPELVANYVRERLLESRVETGPAMTVFSGAKLRVDPARTLRVDVVAHNGDTDLTVRDETRPPAVPGLTDEERWKQLGLSPKGTPLDPTHLE
jgi:hypothetical protein